LEQTEQDIDKDVERLQAYVDELQELGVELRSPLDGVVDFPSELDGKPNLLQWRLGEAAVSVGRDWDASGADRHSAVEDLRT
jgi:hypothetical protein